MHYFVMAGIDYENSSVEIREKVNFTASAVKRAYEKIKAEGILKEAVILSTCNRSEIYAVIDDSKNHGYIKKFYSSFFGIASEEIEDNIVCRNGLEAIQHLFEVTNGFKSMVLGEDQILGQVKSAYQQALSNNSGGKLINKLFLSAITNAKKVKTKTGISNRAVSVSSIGIKLLTKHFGSLKGKCALIVGLGKMSKLAIDYLLSEGIEKIIITNRTKKKAIDFKCYSPNIDYIDFEERYSVIKNIDIIISSTSAPHFVIHNSEFIKNYYGKPICILDLAVPRDVEPEISKIDGVTLYVIDNLKKIAEENEEKKVAAYKIGMVMLQEDIDKFIDWLNKEHIEAELGNRKADKLVNF